MDIQITLNNGQVITLMNAGFDATNFTSLLNERSITFVNFGGTIVNKNLILSVIPLNVLNTSESGQPEI